MLWLLLLFAAYTLAKYGMSVCVLGMSEEFKKDGVAVNALWPQTGEIMNTVSDLLQSSIKYNASITNLSL